MNVSPTASSSRTALGALLARLHGSAVGWSWIFNALRLASGFILLPLVLTKLAKPELGMYYVLLSLAALVPLVDFGFGPTIGRFVTYAMGGAESIQARGIAKPGSSVSPNYALLWELLFTTRVLYRFLAITLFVVLGAWGTYVVELRIQETVSPTLTRLAWGATLLTAVIEIYANWWITYLRSMNEVLAAVRIGVLGWGLRLLLAAFLLLLGAGLLSLPVGSFFGSLLQRFLARRRVYQLLARYPAPQNVEVRQYLRILWPNTWRLGVQFLSGYLTVNANTALCLYWFGLNANAQYGLSVQLLGFISGMSSVWISVKWPGIGQCRARHDLVGVQRILWPRVWIQSVTFIIGCAAVLVGMPLLLTTMGGGKQILPLAWMVLLMLNGFFEMQFTLWGTLLSTENRLPYLWPAVATNVLSLIFSFGLLRSTSFGLGALVLGPFLAGILFNHWYWPPYAARSLGTNLRHFLFHRPPDTQINTAPSFSRKPAAS
jgi:hypothetical protein